MSAGGTGRDGRWAVPIRQVFPWWYLGGAIVSVLVLIAINPDGNQSAFAFWGPAIGVAIRDREQSARKRLDEGLPVDRASLLSPAWLEPVCAVLLIAASVGLSLVLDALFGHRTVVTTWFGAGLLVGSAAGFGALLLVLRAARRRREASDVRSE